jgi:hypothetical protein
MVSVIGSPARSLRNAAVSLGTHTPGTCASWITVMCDRNPSRDISRTRGMVRALVEWACATLPKTVVTFVPSPSMPATARSMA